MESLFSSLFLQANKLSAVSPISLTTQVPFTTMARSFTVFFAFLGNALSRCGYGTTTRGFATIEARGGASSTGGKVAKKLGEEVVTTQKESWVPDPVTGYYKSENSKEIDVTELRATLLGRK